jgi:hypothetical protein
MDIRVKNRAGNAALANIVEFGESLLSGDANLSSSRGIVNYIDSTVREMQRDTVYIVVQHPFMACIAYPSIYSKQSGNGRYSTSLSSRQHHCQASV